MLHPAMRVSTSVLFPMPGGNNSVSLSIKLVIGFLYMLFIRLRKFSLLPFSFCHEYCIQFSSVAQSCLTPCNSMNRSTPGLLVHHQIPESIQTHVHRVGDAIQPSHPLSSRSPPVPNPSQIRVFSNESALHIRWPNYWSFSFNISSSNEYPGLISFRIDWLDLLADQGTLKSLLQHHSSKASILQHSAFFIVQLSHPYDHWKNHSLD